MNDICNVGFYGFVMHKTRQNGRDNVDTGNHWESSLAMPDHYVCAGAGKVDKDIDSGLVFNCAWVLYFKSS